ncbi:MAG: hypothetical protein K1X74_08955 [Pirellulales bacterium]|nr:hypothetical protein [Pirellulales bacterium]
MNQLLLLAQAASRTTFEWGRIQSNSDWLAPLGVLAVLVLYVRFWYRRDGVDLKRPVGWLCTALRVLALAGIVAIYLRPQWRSEHFQPQNSRVLMLVDNSLSMQLDDTEPGATAGGMTRAQRVIETFSGGDWLDKLCNVHDVLVFRFGQTTERVATLAKRLPVDAAKPAAKDPAPVPDWANLLAPAGAETRLGAALREVIDDQRGGPVSGVVLLTDGGQNAGPDTRAAVAAAQEAKLPIHAVGLGTDQLPANVRVADLLAPVRAQPGDRFTVTGFIQAQGLAGQTVVVDLFSRAAGEAAGGERLEESREVTLGVDSEMTPVRFELTPAETGRRTLALRIKAPTADRVPTDNAQEADVEIVDRNLRILLLASGPTREYQFVRNLLQRDKYTTVDVLLQSGQAGISQDANEILAEFPTTRDEMFAYDGIVAFDVRWTELSAAQIELLETWVADQAGGLVLIAGPVHMSHWVQDQQLAPLRALFPVELDQRIVLGDEERYGSTTPWPLEWMREGLEAEFLWLADNPSESAARWESFPGVYGYYAVRGAKPAATVYARFGDPQVAAGGEAPIYMAGQFYGAGRVFYLGSGEMWRLRSVDEALFETFYTKLVRNVTQGRLLRGSSRGTLLVERDRYFVGQSVAVRAQLSNEQHEPLTLPTVTLQIVRPDGGSQTLTLAADASRAGNFAGQFSVRQEGIYRLEIPGDDEANPSISRRIQVRVPDLEREDPRRNDSLLAALARDTGGQYYVGLNDALGLDGKAPLVDQLRDRTRTRVITDKAIPLWNNFWMMGFVVGSLGLEWLVRRLSRLA